MIPCDDIHPSERTEIGICDSEDHCVTPGQRRKLNVHFSRDAMGWYQPVLAICKGCARRARKNNKRTIKEIRRRLGVNISPARL